MLVNVYGLYDESGTLCHQGTATELKNRFEVNHSPSSTAPGKRYLGKYYVKKIGQTEQAFESIHPKRYSETKEERTLEYLRLHLQKYGNTVLSAKNVDDYVRKLKVEGINCKARKTVSMDGRRKSYYYVLEVI